MATIVTKVKCIEILDVPCEPIYVAWENSVGGYSYHMFEYNQEVSDVTNLGDVFEKAVFDLEDAQGTFESLTKFPGRKIIMEATRVTRSQYEGLKEINSSPKIYQMFALFDDDGLPINRDSQGNPRRIELLTVSTTSIIQTKNNLFNIKFQLEFPRVFTQTHA